MRLSILLCWVFLLLQSQCQESCPIAQYYQFLIKQNIFPYPIISNPYKNPTPEYIQRVTENLSNKERVCALQYKDKEKRVYELKQFKSKQAAQVSGWIVTHQGVCGKCSTTQDLYVYLNKDLTRPVRTCGLKNFYSINKLRTCIRRLGFSKPCTQVWVWNTLYTRKKCGRICFWSYITNQPFVINGQLNKCLQCDEDKSGPIFKYESGRTRRNSGIKSQIDRPKDQVYNLTHCYY